MHQHEPSESKAFIADPSLIVEEKLDGTNVGIHFTSAGRMVLQCRGHEITEGMEKLEPPTIAECHALHLVEADRPGNSSVCR